MGFNADRANAERKARVERRTAVRDQIQTDQQANAKRDKKALARESKWLRKNSQK